MVQCAKHRGAEGACWAHNPKVGGSKPFGATFLLYSLHFQPTFCFIFYINNKKKHTTYVTIWMTI
jgi:hypothetical protein